MKHTRELSPASFDRLLRELSPDRDRAAAEYEALRSRLTKFFQWRRCPDPELLADRTLDRLAHRLDGGAEIEQVYSYCCGIARHLMLEAQRTREREAVIARDLSLIQPAPRGGGEALLFEALQGCLEGLPAPSRRLILEYYDGDRLRKIEHRGDLARRLGIPLTALRSRAFRVRAAIENCVQETLERRNVRAKSDASK